tara:strand:- start:43 stop:261 length:219 start_codon:yes stop_codon:yes gene_type:complete
MTTINPEEDIKNLQAKATVLLDNLKALDSQRQQTITDIQQLNGAIAYLRAKQEEEAEETEEEKPETEEKSND